MVCVPCFIIPVLLFIWHKFFQPILLRYWNPWEKKDAQGNVIKNGPEFPFECKNGVCPFVPSNKQNQELDSTAEQKESDALLVNKTVTNTVDKVNNKKDN